MKSTLVMTLFSTLMFACAIDDETIGEEEEIEDYGEPEGAEDATDEEIQNGTATTAYPAVGALSITYNGGGTGLCTATIVTPTKMLTAAHCLRFKKGDKIFTATAVSARFGASSGSATRFAARDWTIHPSWNFDFNAGNDYAVIRFASSAVSKNRPPIKARVVGINSMGPRVIVGYGETSKDVGSGTKRAGVAIVSSDNNKHLGMSTTGKAVHSCPGDSGGPTLHKINGVNYIVGTSSYGNGNCDARSLAFYADLSAAAAWLRSHGIGL